MLLRASLKGFVILLFFLSGNAHSTRYLIEPPLSPPCHCVQGYVLLSFTVEKNTAVNVKITESSPAGVFDDHVRRVIRLDYFDIPDGTKIESFRIRYPLPEGCESELVNIDACIAKGEPWKPSK